MVSGKVLALLLAVFALAGLLIVAERSEILALGLSSQRCVQAATVKADQAGGVAAPAAPAPTPAVAEVKQSAAPPAKPDDAAEMSRRVDLEIARRVAKLPANLLPPEEHTKMMQRLLPDAMARWSCGRDFRNAEKLLRDHPAMHSNLDGREYFNRLMSVVSIFSWQRLENKTFLEVGFGIGLMTALLRGLNTTVYATEIQPISWTPSRHGPFFEVMEDLVREAAAQGSLGPRFDVERAAAYGRQCGSGVPNIAELSTTMEQLEGVPDASVDVSYSLAVLEHITEAGPSFKALARVSRVGSVSCHQIDQRDHRNFSRPWDFFLMPDGEFKKKTIGSSMAHPYFGNRIRLREFMTAAAANGFQTVHVTRQHEVATPEGLKYAEDMLRKLRAKPVSTHRYADWPVEDFNGCTSNKMPQTGLFLCFRYQGSQAVPPELELPACGVDVWNRDGFSLH